MLQMEHWHMADITITTEIVIIVPSLVVTVTTTPEKGFGIVTCELVGMVGR